MLQIRVEWHLDQYLVSPAQWRMERLRLSSVLRVLLPSSLPYAHLTLQLKSAGLSGCLRLFECRQACLLNLRRTLHSRHMTMALQKESMTMNK